MQQQRVTADTTGLRTKSATTATATDMLLDNNSSRSSNRRLLLKQKMHLNLNVKATSNDENDVENVGDNAGFSVTELEAAAIVSKRFNKDGLNVETVTTVPKQQQKEKQQIKNKRQHVTVLEKTQAVTTTTTTKTSTAATLVDSSAITALAKFNRIIDNTLEQQQQNSVNATAAVRSPTLSNALQQRLTLVYPDMLVADNSKINSATITTAKTGRSPASALPSTASSASLTSSYIQKAETTATSTHQTAGTTRSSYYSRLTSNDDDNQMKRNDVHYLLKQLNSFSDIEEIEITDIEQTQQRQQAQQTSFELDVAMSNIKRIVQPSPTTTSLVISSPTSQSHKGIRRYASLYNNQEQVTVANLEHDQYKMLAYDAAAATAASTAAQQQYFLQQFDDYLFQSCHYLETNYFAANYRTAMVESSSHEFRPSTTTPTTTTHTNSDTFELHEVEPPSVICKASAPPPPQYYHQAETRLTSSGVQTELTAESLAKFSCTGSNNSSADSSGSRPTPFFKCCYTPIDRWRERRHAVAKSRKNVNGCGGGGGGVGGGASKPATSNNGSAV